MPLLRKRYHILSPFLRIPLRFFEAPLYGIRSKIRILIDGALLESAVFDQCEFIGSAGRRDQFPADVGNEIAFAGRSNAGKSSAINALIGRTRLARTSKTPGRTQTINFFHLAQNYRLVDLPGYGYAKAPTATIKAWSRLVQSYIKLRQSLCAVVILIDARRPLLDSDQRFIECCMTANRPLHLALTKSDKLSKHIAIQNQRNVRNQLQDLIQNRRLSPGKYPDNNVSVQLLSSQKRIGVDELRAIVTAWLEIDSCNHTQAL